MILASLYLFLLKWLTFLSNRNVGMFKTRPEKNGALFSLVLEDARAVKTLNNTMERHIWQRTEIALPTQYQYNIIQEPKFQPPKL